jgi:hypothetical protein
MQQKSMIYSQQGKKGYIIQSVLHEVAITMEYYDGTLKDTSYILYRLAWYDITGDDTVKGAI